jgi:hypothetical protein
MRITNKSGKICTKNGKDHVDFLLLIKGTTKLRLTKIIVEKPKPSRDSHEQALMMIFI